MGNLLGGLDRKPSNWWRISVAVLAPAIALLIKLLLAPASKQESPFVLFYAAVLASDRYGLGVDTAIPCGLIINKLVSNALKYAFPRKKEGEIKLDLINKQKKLFLSVSNNRVGLPKKIDIQNTESLESKIVNALTEQLQDSIETNPSQGTEFKIKFSVWENI